MENEEDIDDPSYCEDTDDEDSDTDFEVVGTNQIRTHLGLFYGDAHKGFENDLFVDVGELRLNLELRVFF